MSDDMVPEALLIDWAGTITVPMGEMMALAAERLGLDDEDVAKAFGGLAEYMAGDNSLFHQAERGEVADEDLRAFIEEKAPGAGRLFDPTGPSFFDAPDRPEMAALLERLRDEDITVVMATNNFASMQELLAKRYLDTGMVSAIANSALMGARKPEPAFYERCLDAVGVDASAALFVDDMRHNIDGAEALGIRSILVGSDTA
ncbi:MAG: HAD-IA family hydrolase [Actinomycetota bacterium]